MSGIGHYLKYPYAEVGTVAAVLAAFAIYYLGKGWVYLRNRDSRERHRKSSAISTILLVAVVFAVVLLWARAR